MINKTFEVEAIRFKAGRPTKYTDRESPKQLREYLRECANAKKTPFIEEFALKIGVDERTAKAWVGKHTKFENEYNKLLTMQKFDLKRRALSGEYVPKIAELLLSAEHDVVMRIKKEVGNLDGKPLQVEQTLSPSQIKEYSETITGIFEKIYSGDNSGGGATPTTPTKGHGE